MSAHCIRLRGPWQVDGDPARVVQLPRTVAEFLGMQLGPHVRLTRRFNAPTGLDTEHSVYVVVESPLAVSDVSLNDQPLFGPTGVRYAVERLERSNVLSLVLGDATAPALSSQPSALEVRLEIETPDGLA